MKRRNQMIAIVLVCVMAVSLGGCRYSEKIQQLIYNQFLNGIIDYNPPFDMNDNQETNEIESDEIPELDTSEDSEREQEEQKAGILADNDQTETSSSGYSVTYSEDGESSASADVYVASDDGEETDADITAGGNSPENTVTSTEDYSEEEEAEDGLASEEEETEGGLGDYGETGDTGEEDGSGETNDLDSSGEAEVSNDEPTSKKIVDKSGNKVEVPEDVHTVATIGEAAIMISILRAGESVVATDATTLNLAKNGVGSSVISDLSGATALWSGDGSDGISNYNFNKLVSLAPDIVIEFSGSTALTDSQVEKLENNGIYYMALPELDSLEDVTDSMDLLGQLFEDTDYEEASDWAEDYISFVEDDVIKNVDAASGTAGFYTLYVDDWDSSAACTVSHNVNGSVSVQGGTAVLKNKVYTETIYLCDILDQAGVDNTIDNFGISASTKKIEYYVPLYPRTSSISVSGGSLASETFPKSYKFLEPSDTVSLGTAKFPCVIAADESTKNGIEKSASYTQGQWTVYSKVTDAHNAFEGYGFLDAGGYIVSSEISGDYDVYVNPSGFDSWTEGTCESVLESVWAAWKITGKMAEDDMVSYLNEFYSTFYDYDLTTSEINNILNED